MRQNQEHAQNFRFLERWKVFKHGFLLQASIPLKSTATISLEGLCRSCGWKGQIAHSFTHVLFMWQARHASCHYSTNYSEHDLWNKHHRARSCCQLTIITSPVHRSTLIKAWSTRTGTRVPQRVFCIDIEVSTSMSIFLVGFRFFAIFWAIQT